MSLSTFLFTWTLVVAIVGLTFVTELSSQPRRQDDVGKDDRVETHADFEKARCW